MSNIYVSLLGISGAVPSKKYDNTFLAIRGFSHTALIDCGGSPLQKLQLIGIKPVDLDMVIVTHRHPDHIYGFPSLLQGLSLLNKRTPLTICALRDSLDTISSLMALFELKDSVESFLELDEVPLIPSYKIIDNKYFSISTLPVNHSVPTIAVKIKNKISNRTLVYSSDTGPCKQLIEFAANTDILIHECNSLSGVESSGHTNGIQAGRIARKANAKKLVLVHLPVLTNILTSVEEARTEFQGDVTIPEPFSTYVI